MNMKYEWIAFQFAHEGLFAIWAGQMVGDRTLGSWYLICDRTVGDRTISFL